jgi:hypothetical protein
MAESLSSNFFHVTSNNVEKRKRPYNVMRWGLGVSGRAHLLDFLQWFD